MADRACVCEHVHDGRPQCPVLDCGCLEYRPQPPGSQVFKVTQVIEVCDECAPKIADAVRDLHAKVDRLSSERDRLVRNRDGLWIELRQANSLYMAALDERDRLAADLAEIQSLVDQYQQSRRQAFDREALAGAVVRTVEHQRSRASVTHQCPPEGSGTMPCCDRTPFEVPRSDRITLDGEVTCRATPAPPSALRVLWVIVYGVPAKVAVDASGTLRDAVPAALAATDNLSARPVRDWEVRDPLGALLPLETPLEQLPADEGFRLFLNLRAGIGGSEPASTVDGEPAPAEGVGSDG